MRNESLLTPGLCTTALMFIPDSSPTVLYRYVIRHAGDLRSTGRLHRPVEDEVIDRFLECGDPCHGFASIYCDAFGHDLANCGSRVLRVFLILQRPTNSGRKRRGMTTRKLKTPCGDFFRSATSCIGRSRFFDHVFGQLAKLYFISCTSIR